jgi:hypothetical protein
MSLQPNPPRLITIALALVLFVVGISWAWPIDVAVNALMPVQNALAGFGIVVNRELGYLFLFLSPSLLVIGSLLPGI